MRSNFLLQQKFMAESSIISKFLHWLQSTEMFASPSKQLPGKWQLYEYFVETEGELANFKQNDLDASDIYWKMEIRKDGTSSHLVNLDHFIIQQVNDGNWMLHKNLISFSTKTDPLLQFQFAVTNHQLKLLKKDNKGAILFFGFFDRIA